MKSLISILVLCLLAYGLWAHDWTTIIAALCVAIVWPIVEYDVRERQDQRIWDTITDPRNKLGSARSDDDLSDSA